MKNKDGVKLNTHIYVCTQFSRRQIKRTTFRHPLKIHYHTKISLKCSQIYIYKQILMQTKLKFENCFNEN